MDNPAATAGNDTFNADNTGTSNTFSVADVVDGGAGTDTLKVWGHGTNSAILGTISNVENIIFDNSATAVNTNVSAATGVTSVTVSNAVGTNNLTVAAGVAVTLTTNASTASSQTVNYAAADTSASLTLNGVNTTTTVDVALTGAAVATVNLATTGAASSVGQLEVGATMTKVVVTGDKDLTIVDAVEEAVEVIDASAFTGKLSVILADQATTPDALVGTVDVTDITVTGGSGNDTINAASVDDDVEITIDAGAGDDTVTYVKTATQALVAATSILAGDSIKGGAGTDTFSVDGDLTADLTGIVSGFETLEFTGAAAGTDMSANKLGITNFVVTGAIDVVLTGVAAASTVKITDANDSDITATIGTDSAADVISVNLESAGATSGSTITLTNYETLNLSSTKATADLATVANTAQAIAATGVSTLAVSGTQDLTITTAALKAASTVTNTSTGALTSTFSTTVGTYTGSAAVDTLTLVAGNLAQGSTFAGGAGADTLTQVATSAQDAGILALTGFETVVLTTHTTAGDAYKADFRNVTDLTTLTLNSGDDTDTLTLNRLSSDTTLNFNDSFGATVTTLNTGTSQKVAFAANSTVASLTLDSGATAMSIASATGVTGVITTLSGTSLATVTVTGAGATTITNALGTTVTKVDASAATGALTVTASATATTILGSEAADTITGGAGADIITGGKGADTLVGGAEADSYIFASTGALNGADIFAANIVGGSGGDILNFKNFLSGGSLLSATATEFNGTADTAIANKVILLASANTDVTAVDTVGEIAALIEGTGDAMSLASGGKAIIIAGDDSAATAGAKIYFVDDTLDGVNGTVSATDVVIVGVATLDIDTILAANLAFA